MPKPPARTTWRAARPDGEISHEYVWRPRQLGDRTVDGDLAAHWQERHVTGSPNTAMIEDFPARRIQAVIFAR
ncbi:MAG: hypothetical protein M3144_08035 [Actinomycetota bacterium]|nr:hypothetical protein [Actinomycetota bacterium]